MRSDRGGGDSGEYMELVFIVYWDIYRNINNIWLWIEMVFLDPLYIVSKELFHC